QEPSKCLRSFLDALLGVGGLHQTSRRLVELTQVDPTIRSVLLYGAVLIVPFVDVARIDPPPPEAVTSLLRRLRVDPDGFRDLAPRLRRVVVAPRARTAARFFFVAAAAGAVLLLAVAAGAALVLAFAAGAVFLLGRRLVLGDRAPLRAQRVVEALRH